jgi:hypothetical protein
MTTNWNEAFRDALRCRGREVYNNDTRRLIQRWQKCVEITETLRENMYESSTYISLLSEFHFLKKIRGITSHDKTPQCAYNFHMTQVFRQEVSTVVIRAAVPVNTVVAKSDAIFLGPFLALKALEPF